jgi:glutathione synthase/RimK-type ligase-like ATP-grasp enzyme
MNKTLSIAVGVDANRWHEKFAAALDGHIEAGRSLRYEFVDMTRHDWLEAVRPFDLVLWKPHYMGNAAANFKEKIYVLERHAGKMVVPNYDTIWHFESKIAQSYLFALEDVPTPATTVSFEYGDAMREMDLAAMPVVVKKSNGAASKYVQLVRHRRQTARLATSAFCDELYCNARREGESKFRTCLRNLWKPWLWKCFANQALGYSADDYLYWQEFLSGNDADLRITVIGDRYAYGFWRRNRPGDFRASGSGRLDFERPIPEPALRYCLNLSRRMNFDSMAYDILFRGDDFLINEMSYGYLDSAPYKAAGYYELASDGTLAFVANHTWPQTLWVNWALHRADQKSGSRTSIVD